MPIGHLVEALLSKVASITGDEGYATPFLEDQTVNKISSLLHGCGYQRNMTEVLFSGHTGKMFTTKIFFGPTYYQRLKHMVDDKIHSRARGRLSILVRQPVEGRAREGGLRFGEMERDCMIGHGAGAFLKESLLDRSDRYTMHVGTKSGLASAVNEEKNLYDTFDPDDPCGTSKVQLPYAFRLLSQELQSMAIAPRLVTK